jgi:hypothetical protein
VKNRVRYATRHPATVSVKLAFTPGSVELNGRSLPKSARADNRGWSFDSATHVLTLRHDAGAVTIAP